MSTLNKVRRILSIGESTAEHPQDTFANMHKHLFNYHDDMYHQKPRPGNTFHLRHMDPVHSELRKQSAEKYFNLTGQRLRSRHDGKLYPVPEMKIESTAHTEHRSLGYETARRIHGGMGGMNYTDTMAAVKKVRLRTTNPAELEAFYAGAEHYCQKNCYKESVDEATTTYADLAAKHRAKAEEFRKTPAARFVPQFGDKAGRVRERYVSYHSKMAHHYETLAAQKTESYVAESDIDFKREYLYRSERAIHNHRMGRHLIAAAHQKAAEEHAESYFKKTGKKIVDPLYTGSSKYISQLSSEATTPKVKNARIQAWHWMGAKKAMGAKYGFDHNVPVNQIPTSMEHNGKTVNPRRAVIWVAQQFANRDKAKKNMKEETGKARFQVLAGGQDSGSAGTVHDSMDDAWLAAKKLKKHPQYKTSSITIHDRDTGFLHSLTGRIIGRLATNFDESSSINEKKCSCWKGYKRVPGTKPCSNNSCTKVQEMNEKKEHQNPTGGLSQKGRDYYNRKHGSNLQAPVTTPPSKLKPGSKAANRRKSFCARMSGVDGPMKDEKGRPTRKALALRKWNC